MTNPVIDAIRSRTAAKYYDPHATLSDAQISVVEEFLLEKEKPARAGATR